MPVFQKMIYSIHEEKGEVSGIVKPNGWGKQNNSYKITQEQKEKVIARILSCYWLALLLEKSQ